MKTLSKITAELAAVGVKAALAIKDAKLRAKVNHVDNFALYCAPFAKDAILGVIEAKMDKHDEYVDWLNRACVASDKDDLTKSQLHTLCNDCGRTAYYELQPKRRP